MDCPKVTYHSRREARHAAKLLRSNAGAPFRAYACPDCGGWHVSTEERIEDLEVRLRRAIPRRHGRRLRPGEDLETVAATMRPSKKP